ncbi:MAG: hypothetical protein EOM24_15525 [Chloroflexia bacterium]|nr:hypothetical protein [Chloroflexia bacterium]
MVYVPQDLSDTTSNRSSSSGALPEGSTGLPKQPGAQLHHKTRFTAIGSLARRFPCRLKAGSPRAVAVTSSLDCSSLLMGRSGTVDARLISTLHKHANERVAININRVLGQRDGRLAVSHQGDSFSAPVWTHDHVVNSSTTVSDGMARAIRSC